MPPRVVHNTNKVTNELTTLDALLHKLDVVSQTSSISQRECVHQQRTSVDFYATALKVPLDVDVKKLLGGIIQCTIILDACAGESKLSHTNNSNPFICGINLKSIVTASLAFYTHPLLGSRHPVNILVGGKKSR